MMFLPFNSNTFRKKKYTWQTSNIFIGYAKKCQFDVPVYIQAVPDYPFDTLGAVPKAY
jgi:hypothetical protein